MFGYGEDVRDWADRILDDAPPVPASAWVVRAATVLTPELRPDSLLALLLAEDGEFTAEIAAKRYDCWPSSVRVRSATTRSISSRCARATATRPPSGVPSGRANERV